MSCQTCQTPTTEWLQNPRHCCDCVPFYLFPLILGALSLCVYVFLSTRRPISAIASFGILTSHLASCRPKIKVFASLRLICSRLWHSWFQCITSFNRILSDVPKLFTCSRKFLTVSCLPLAYHGSDFRSLTSTFRCFFVEKSLSTLPSPTRSTGFFLPFSSQSILQ